MGEKMVIIHQHLEFSIFFHIFSRPGNLGLLLDGASPHPWQSSEDRGLPTSPGTAHANALGDS